MAPVRAASLAAVLAVGVAAASAAAQDPSPARVWRAPDAGRIVVPARGDGPLLAAGPLELARLRAAFTAGLPAVGERVARARRALRQPLQFPPRGGQHNQWYQCTPCQIGLQTVDPEHHRCPRCGEVYSGPPYDDVLFARTHDRNLQRALDAAWAFALSDEPAFADDAAAVLLGYADRYRGYPYHSNHADPSKPLDSGGHLEEQTLGEASSLASRIAPAIDLIWPRLDPRQIAQLRQGLLQPMVQNIAKCRRGRSNWQSWHNAAMFAAGVLLDDAEWLRRSVLADGQGFLFQMGAGVSADGMWYENSWGYHFYTLRALVLHAETAGRCGVDLWHPALVAMCALPARCTMADGSLPRFGDDVGSRAEAAGPHLRAAFAATGEPALRSLLPADRGWDAVRFGQDGGAGAPATAPPALDVLPGAGHAILRQPGASAALSFGPFGGFHGHFDKLAFVWFAAGRERGVDPGRAASQAYRLPIHNGWYRATLAHNAVLVDGRSQEGAAGELLGSAQGPDFVAVAVRTTSAYRGVEHRRCLILHGERLLVLDRLRADRERTWTWLYHDRAERLAAAPAGEVPVPGAEAPDLAGLGFAAVHGWTRTDAPVRAVFAGAEGGALLQAAAAPATLVLRADGPGRSVLDRVPFVALQRSGREAAFAVLLVATAGEPSPADLGGIELAPAGDGLRVRVGADATAVTWEWDGAAGIGRR